MKRKVSPPMVNISPAERVFCCTMPACFSYSDRTVEVGGDYKTLARFFFDTCTLWIASDCPNELRNFINDDCAHYRPGDVIQTSTCGQTITLGRNSK